MKLHKVFETSTVKDEFRVWSQLIAPKLNLPQNIFSICHYGFTEMLNNVLEHSRSKNVTIHCTQNEFQTLFEISDDGVGVFTSLCTYFQFDSNIHALIELVKGKLTVAPEAHSGEGIFFSSKMFDQFIIEADDLLVTFEANECSVRSIPNRHGTSFRMKISNDSLRTTQEIFARYTEPEELTFCKTRFFVSLAAFEGELISRSQAKRIVARFENFEKVELDFNGVNNIGQGFADELVRVWPLAHPATQLFVTNASEPVEKMLRHVEGRSDLPQPAIPVAISR